MQEWQPIETVPDSTFDVLAKYWDASLDMFLYRRFIDCIQVGGEVFVGRGAGQDKLTAHGFRPMYWMPTPTLPSDLEHRDDC